MSRLRHFLDLRWLQKLLEFLELPLSLRAAGKEMSRVFQNNIQWKRGRRILHILCVLHPFVELSSLRLSTPSHRLSVCHTGMSMEDKEVKNVVIIYSTVITITINVRLIPEIWLSTPWEIPCKEKLQPCELQLTRALQLKNQHRCPPVVEDGAASPATQCI